MNTQDLCLVVLLSLLWHVSGEFRLPEYCKRFAEGDLHNSGNGDAGFEITIRRLPERARVENWFEPDREYLVTLENRLPRVTFDDFLFWLEPTEPPMMGHPHSVNTTTDCNRSPDRCVGSWVHPKFNPFSKRILGKMTHNRPGCWGLVAECFPRRGSQCILRKTGKHTMRWRSPSSSRHNCVTLGAMAMVRTQTSVLKEVGGLTKTLCPIESS
ncbi:hypothetical protein Aperf_G00000113748 [Anoplocephala perfoliata]